MRSVSGCWPVLGLLCALAATPASAAGNSAALAAPSLSRPAAPGGFVQRVLADGSHEGLPFAVVDKHAATIHVFHADGRLAGRSSVLLGQTPGDHSVPGVGERAQTGRLTADDRTTAAGRFRSEPGRNKSGEAIVWLDYENALAIHRLRPGRGYDARAERLASADARLKRMSDGCVVVPEAFYDGVVAPVLGRGTGIVYILPETEPWQAQYEALTASVF
jgi:hypothetical protein